MATEKVEVTKTALDNLRRVANLAAKVARLDVLAASINNHQRWDPEHAELLVALRAVGRWRYPVTRLEAGQEIWREAQGESDDDGIPF